MTHSDLDDPERLAGIDALEVVGRPRTAELDAVVDLAARVCGVPLAAISILTDTEQLYLAATGFGGAPCAVDDSMCIHTLHSGEPIVVPDCREDPRYRDNPHVDGRHNSIRFYASARLVSRAGHVVGTLCVYDLEPRHLDPPQVDALVTLADRVVDVLELSLRTRQLAASLAELETVRDDLERSNDRLASFAGQVAHDLRTPLTGMALSLGVARDEVRGQDPTSSALSMLERAIGGAARMGELIDEVLSFSQVGGVITLGDVALGDVVRHVRNDLWDHLQGVELEVEELPVVVADRVQIRVVLQNLVENAAKFVDPSRSPVITVRAVPRRSGWRIEVADNGRGVPADEVGRMFARQARVDHAVDGFGIGLATCRLIVEAHGGTIGLDPRPGGGTTAWFELPSS